ncbi:Condensin-2 complex subunit H2 [Quillaja saponaria]|uniref:Condensin-2 complex subunit H2 n=1 Tax=Quillaja saponaria TaxID=32244 RepID=A0AAD7QF27_QUISA|nr:Condensin-2 complex subunit H2 [Quillaja saponaria]
MTKDTEEPSSGGGFHTVHAERDPASNWEVDLAKKLEEYLLKICSGEITGEDDGHIPVNFAEAALLLQGSVQVYSRKVEYLYTLVVRALEFLSQKSQQDQLDSGSNQPKESGSCTVGDEETDLFWVSEDIPVEEKNSLDSTGKDATSSHFVKPPANLIVLEGDCLDTAGDSGELESYLLATSDVYQDFILLDTCDAVAVQEFLKGNKGGKGKNGVYRDSSTRKSFLSPIRCSGGTAHKSSAGKNQHANINSSPHVDCSFDVNNIRTSPSASPNLDDANVGFDMDDRYSEPGECDDSDDDDDPWKPLNPHEPGNLRVKPFRKVKVFRRNGINPTRQANKHTLFPLAKLHGPVSPELMDLWEKQRHAHERQRGSQSPPLYEKLRQSLINGGHETCAAFSNPENHNDDNGYDSGNPDFDMPENMYVDEDVPLHSEKHDAAAAHDDTNKASGQGPEYPNFQASLEDLCRSHLDALLASIAETEKQTEIAARVSTWKQKIEHNLEEQESCPPFDIHEYGQRILDKLSLEASNTNASSFSDVVKGQEKYDVARTFSALLQLVNNGDVELGKSGVDAESVCYTAANPFHVRLLNHDKRQENGQLRLSKKRAKSPTRKTSTRGDKNKSGCDKSPTLDSSCKKYRPIEFSSPTNSKFSVKIGKVSYIRCSPEGKRRRRSKFVEPVDLHSVG